MHVAPKVDLAEKLQLSNFVRPVGIVSARLADRTELDEFKALAGFSWAKETEA